METRKCPVCDAPVIGRSDKKYCSDQCRAVANNQFKQKTQKLIIDTNKRLRRNRTILKTLSPVGKATVRKTVLENMGDDFLAFTALYLPSTGNLYYLCYDYGFSPIVQRGIERALIITKQSYVGGWQPWQFAK